MAGIWPGLIFLGLGWLVFSWLPGVWFARRFDRLNGRMNEIIGEYGQGSDQGCN